MAAAVPIFVGSLIAATTGKAVVSMVKDNITEQKDAAMRASQEQSDAVAKQQADFEAQQKKQTEDIAAQNDTANPANARNQQKKKAQAAYGRTDTILTGPLGITGPAAPNAGKTLLGS